MKIQFVVVVVSQNCVCLRIAWFAIYNGSKTEHWMDGDEHFGCQRPHYSMSIAV